MRYVALCNNRVIDIKENVDTAPKYPPDKNGNEIIVHPCDDENVQIGFYYENGEFIENNRKIEENDETPQPTQADRIEENQLALMEAVASMYEESLENRLNDQEVQATIYETLLEMGGN